MVKIIICKTDGAEIMVDDEDYSLLSRFRWYRGGMGEHPMTFIYGKNDASHTVYMHQIIMGGIVGADHIDRNVLNMQKSNLRPATTGQNNANKAKKLVGNDGKPRRSKYKGVFPQGKRWGARIGFNRKPILLGTHDTEEQAALAYNKKAKELFGEYAWMNPVEEMA